MRKFFVLALALAPGLALAQDAVTPGGFDHQKTLESVATRSEAMAARIAAAREKVLALRSEIIQDNLKPTRLLLVHKNEMGQSFTVENIEYKLDNVPIVDEAKPIFDATGQLQLFDGELRAGAHEIKVLVVYMGTGVGPFPTLGGYRYEVRRTLKVEVPEGRLTEAQIIGFMRDDEALDAKQRFDVRIESSVVQLMTLPPK